MCPDYNSPEDSGKSYEKNHSQHFTDKNHTTGAPDPHVCPLNRKCRAQCLAWRTGSLPLALRWFAEYHDWHESGHLGNQLKLRLVFKKPIRATANKLLAVGLDGLAGQIKKEFKRLLEMCQPLDGVRGRLIVEEDEAIKLEHTRAYLTESLVELADLVESGQKGSRRCLAGAGVQKENKELNPKERDAVAGSKEKTPKTEWVTYKVAEGLLGVTKSTVSKWVQKGRFTDNGLKRQKIRLSKASVLLVKQAIDDEYLNEYAEELRGDTGRIR